MNCLKEIGPSYDIQRWCIVLPERNITLVPIFWIWYTLYKCHVNESSMRNYHITVNMRIKYMLWKRHVSDYIFTIDRIPVNFLNLFYVIDLSSQNITCARMRITTSWKCKCMSFSITSRKKVYYYIIFFIYVL